MANRDFVDSQLHRFRRKVLLPTLSVFSIIIPLGTIISLIAGSLADYYFIPLIALVTTWAGLIVLLRSNRIRRSFSLFSSGLAVVLVLFPLVTDDPLATLEFFLLFIFVVYSLLTFLAGLLGTRLIINLFPALFLFQLIVTLTVFGDIPLWVLLASANLLVPFLVLMLISLLAQANNREFERIITRLLRSEIQNRNLSSMSMTDPLSGLLNRRNFDDLLLSEFERAKTGDGDLSCIMLDIDRFKSINDSLGHQFGDQVIARIARVIKDNSRSEDICVRYGGEEFLILSRIKRNNARLFADKMLEVVRQTTIDIDGEVRSITVSIGVASMEDGPVDAYDLVKQADRALYRAKHQGRNRVAMTAAAE